MATTVTGLLDTFPDADRVTKALISQGFRRDDIGTQFDNAPGEHAKFPIGGDEYADPEAKKGGLGASVGVIIGGFIGGVIGFAAAMFVALDSVPMSRFIFTLLGVAVGAYIGSMSGGVGKLGKKRGDTTYDPTPVHKGNVMIAVNAVDAQAEKRAAQILRDNGAAEVKQQPSEVFRKIAVKASKSNEKII